MELLNRVTVELLNRKYFSFRAKNISPLRA